MIYFKKKLIEQGAELLNNCREFIELSSEASALQNWIINPINQFNYSNALEIDKKLREKYLEIELFAELADEIAWERGYERSFRSYGLYECVKDRLIFDYNFLCGKALLKAGKITDLVQILL